MIINPYRYAAGGGGGIPVVESYQFSNNGDASTQDLTLVAPTGISANDFLVLIAMADTGYDFWTTTPSGWTKMAGYFGNIVCVSVFYKVASGSETDVTLDSEGTASADSLGWYIRVSGGASLNVEGGGTSGPSTSHVIGSVTTTVDNCLAFYALSFDRGTGEPFGISGTGWTKTDEGHNNTGFTGASGCWGTKEQATAGATGDATVTTTDSDGASHIQFAVAPA